MSADTSCLSLLVLQSSGGGVSPPVTSRSLSLSELLMSGLQCAKVGLMSGLQCAKVGLISGLQCAKVGLMWGLWALVPAAVSGNMALMLKEDLRGVRAITRWCSGPSIFTMLTCEPGENGSARTMFKRSFTLNKFTHWAENVFWNTPAKFS